MGWRLQGPAEASSWLLKRVDRDEKGVDEVSCSEVRCWSSSTTVDGRPPERLVSL